MESNPITTKPSFATVAERKAENFRRCGDCAQDAGQFKRAEVFYIRSVGELEGCVAGACHVRTYSGLGNLYRLLGRYGEADSFLQRAFRAALEAFGEKARETCAVRNDLAVLYKYTGRFREAASLYHCVLKLAASARSGDHLDVATIYHNLGGLEHARGSYKRAERFAREAMELRTQALGPKHPAVAEDAVALGAILVERGKHAEAERLYKMALRTFQKRKKATAHRYDIAVVLNNLAALHQARGELASAKRFYLKALALKERLFGRKHVDVALTLNNLAVLQKTSGEWTAAVRHFKEAHAIFEAVLPPDHPKLVKCRGNLAKLLHERTCKTLGPRQAKTRKGEPRMQ